MTWHPCMHSVASAVTLCEIVHLPSNDWPLPSDHWRFPSKILWRLGCRQVAGGQIIFSRKNWVATSLVKTGFVSTHPDLPGPQASHCHVIAPCHVIVATRHPLLTCGCQ